MPSANKFPLSSSQLPQFNTPYYQGATDLTLNLGALANPLPAIFHYPGHTGIKNLKACHLSIRSISGGTRVDIINLGTDEDVPESFPELSVNHFFFEADDARLTYTLRYEFNDGIIYEKSGESPTYSVIKP